MTPISKGGDRMPSAMSTADLSRHLEHIDAGKSFSDDSSDSSNSNNSISRRAEDSPPRDLQHGDRSSMGEGGDGHRSQGEFSGEPEWQRAPGRWTKREEHLLREMKALVEEDLRAAPPFPEVVGSRRMLRFLRYDMIRAGASAALHVSNSSVVVWQCADIERSASILYLVSWSLRSKVPSHMLSGIHTRTVLYVRNLCTWYQVRYKVSALTRNANPTRLQAIGPCNRRTKRICCLVMILSPN